MTYEELLAETPDERILRKAKDIRDALHAAGITYVPSWKDNEAVDDWASLEPRRQARWLAVAKTYCEHFPGPNGY